MSGDETGAEVRAARRVFVVHLDDQALLWNPDAQQLHRLNAAATLVWDALARWSTVETVSNGLRPIDGLDADRVAHFVDELFALGLLQRRMSSSAQPRSD
jgi:hypothetical protein